MREGRRPESKVAPEQQAVAAHAGSPMYATYPATASSVDLPGIIFRRNRNEKDFTLLDTADARSFPGEDATLSETVRVLGELRLKKLLALVWPEGASLDITIRIIARRTALLKIRQDGEKVEVEAHWNLFIPYFYSIKRLPIAHFENLELFSAAVFRYSFLAMRHRKVPKSELRDVVIDAYLDQPDLLLASLDIFNKPNIYHIHPTGIWFDRISAANDEHRLEIDVSSASATALVSPQWLEEVAGFIHKVAKSYAFRYVDYLWTQRYRVVLGGSSGVEMLELQGKEIVINVSPLIDQTQWRPALYLNLGYAVMLAILQSAGEGDGRENVLLAMMKTWKRYISFDESVERQSVWRLCGLPLPTEEGPSRNLLECMTGRKGLELVNDFILLTDYSAQETFGERLKVLNESPDGAKTGAYYEQLRSGIQNLNTTLMRNNINYGKLIEVLRNDNIDHLQLASLLRTGRLNGRSVADVSEWLLLRTLLYDLINAPKVFRNDYKMLLKVLTKVNKSLIVYVWSLTLDNDARYELVNAYIANLINDIFVFDRVKIYEIVADPAECLEAEAITGYLLNWAGLSSEEWHSISGAVLSRLPHNVATHLSVQTTGDVDLLIRVMTTRASGLIGFCLHQAYRWGSVKDELTERIRFHFRKILRRAEKAMLPENMIRGGAILLLILAQIVSDERDGFARNIEITERERSAVLSLIKQCLQWDQRHFVLMVGGIAAGYMGSIDGWILQQFDTLLGRYGGGDRVVLRSVVQFDVEKLIERTLLTARAGHEDELFKKIQLLRFGVDPVVSDQANKVLGAMASGYGMASPEALLKKKDIRDLVLELSKRMRV